MTESNQNEFVSFKGNKFFVESGILRLKDIGFNDLNEVEGFSNLKNLKELYLIDGSIKDIEPIKCLKNLKVLLITNPHSGAFPLNLNDFSVFSNLKELCLDGLHISKMEGLENLTKLEILSLPANDISEIEGINNLMNLKYLDLSGNKIKEFNKNKLPPNLQELIIYDNPISYSKELKDFIRLSESCDVRS